MTALDRVALMTDNEYLRPWWWGADDLRACGTEHREGSAEELRELGDIVERERIPVAAHSAMVWELVRTH